MTIGNAGPGSLTPRDLGFAGDERTGWIRPLRGRAVSFRLLRTLAELEQAERLQEVVFGVSERDLAPANALLTVVETGGSVLAAFLPDAPEDAAGVLIGWGGFVARRPRIVSDFLAVLPEARNLGLAAELKRLQAALALSHGFVEIVWTVDPLRAANARLNFGKLGATSAHYEIDRYGSAFAAGLYGGMPSDRLHVTWDIASPEILARLRGEAPPAATAEYPNYQPGLATGSALLPIPADIDALLATDPEAARAWRLRVREALPAAFAAGFVITGFHSGGEGAEPAYILRRRS
jgi:predicted GNAT superfamily acetyltransferase